MNLHLLTGTDIFCIVAGSSLIGAGLLYAWLYLAAGARAKHSSHKD